MLIVVGVDAPAVYLDEGNANLSAKKLGILRAMHAAVAAADPGDIIVQEDSQDIPTPEMPILEDRITTYYYNRERRSFHFCPRAFQVPAEPLRQRLLELWSDETQQSCHGWESIPKKVIPWR